MADVVYRHPSEADIEAINDVLNRSGRELPLHRDETLVETREFTIEEEDYDADGFLLAIVNNEAVGYGGSHVYDARIAAGKNDARITAAVVPEHRGKGIEQHFMEFSIDYLRSRKVVKAYRWCSGQEGWRHDLALEFGFKDVRHFFMMVWKQKKAPKILQPPDGISIEDKMFKEASDELIAHFVEGMNDSFADHYNFSPTPVEKFLKWRETDEEISRLTLAKEGEKIVGVCMCEESVLYNKENNTKAGWANILGVSKPYRKRGIARALLTEGMRWIYDRGMDTIYLGMDAENRKALGLYTSLGYQVHTESINYELNLD
jgi:mycothiol synthase